MRYSLYALLFVVLLPVGVMAADTSSVPAYVQDISYTLEQPFGGQSSVSNLAQYIITVYKFALGIVGIIAVVLIMFGGLRWLAAAGNESVVTEAKEIITSAVTGLVIALLSYTILTVVNPQTTNLSLSVFRIPNTLSDIKIVDLVKCDSAGFTGKECQVTGSGNKNCAEVTCNEVGYFDGAYCRGVACGKDEDGNDLGCFRGPEDPDSYACQNTYCGQYAQNCADTGYKNSPSANSSFKSAFNECTCPYYEELATKDLGMGDLRKSTLTDAQGGLFYTLCKEDLPQSTIARGVSADPASYGFSGSAAAALKKGWNCKFTCFNESSKYNYMYPGTATDPTLNCTPD